MIYLTNDSLNQGVYFELNGRVVRNSHEGYSGLVGNGVFEVPVTVRKWPGRVEVDFGSSELFSFVDEDAVRRILGDAIKEDTVH